MIVLVYTGWEDPINRGCHC